MNLDGIDHVALSVTDIERSARWYADVLGFKKQYADAWEVPTFVARGTTAIALFPAGTKGTASVNRPGLPQFLHLAFRADRVNFLAAQQELKARQIPFEFQDHEISHSIYFSDPDGHQLEITTYELS